MCAEFWFSAIIYAEIIVNKSFSTGKPLSSTAQLFERGLALTWG